MISRLKNISLASLTILCGLTLTGCASGISDRVVTHPEQKLLEKCPEELPEAASGRRSDMMENRQASKAAYKACARRHNQLADLPLILDEGE